MSQRQQVITSYNKSPLVEVLAWLFLAITVMSTLARLVTRFVILRTLKVHDHLASAATVAAVGQSVAVILQCGQGLGQHGDTLNSGQISGIMKAGYASSVAFIASQLFAKLSLLIGVMTLAKGGLRRILSGLQIGIIVWAVTAIFVVLFQCRLPKPWDILEGSCINRTAFWSYFCVLDMVSDIAVFVIMIEVVRPIQAAWSKKFTIMGVFGSRIVVVPAIICQIYYFQTALSSSDPTFDMWQATVFLQLVQCLSITTASIPYLKPFLDSLETGQMRGDDMRRLGKGNSSGGGYNSGSRGGDRSGHSSGGRSRITTNPKPSKAPSSSHELDDIRVPTSTRTGNLVTATTTHKPVSSWDGQSHTSQTVLIQQTKTWEVLVEREPREDSSAAS